MTRPPLAVACRRTGPHGGARDGVRPGVRYWSRTGRRERRLMSGQPVRPSPAGPQKKNRIGSSPDVREL